MISKFNIGNWVLILSWPRYPIIFFLSSFWHISSLCLEINVGMWVHHQKFLDIILLSPLRSNKGAERRFKPAKSFLLLMTSNRVNHISRIGWFLEQFWRHFKISLVAIILFHNPTFSECFGFKLKARPEKTGKRKTGATLLPCLILASVTFQAFWMNCILLSLYVISITRMRENIRKNLKIDWVNDMPSTAFHNEIVLPIRSKSRIKETPDGFVILWKPVAFPRSHLCALSFLSLKRDRLRTGFTGIFYNPDAAIIATNV